MQLPDNLRHKCQLRNNFNIRITVRGASQTSSSIRNKGLSAGRCRVTAVKQFFKNASFMFNLHVCNSMKDYLTCWHVGPFIAALTLFFRTSLLNAHSYRSLTYYFQGTIRNTHLRSFSKTTIIMFNIRLIPAEGGSEIFILCRSTTLQEI